jgi:excisionase family DNA binding protein
MAEVLFLSIKSTCDALSVGRTKVYELIGDGRLETVRLGSKRLVKAASVRAFAASLEQAA